MSLTIYSRAELALDTHTIVSNIDSTVMKIQEGVNGKNLPVSITYVPHLLLDGRLPLPRALDSNQVGDLDH